MTYDAGITVIFVIKSETGCLYINSKNIYILTAANKPVGPLKLSTQPCNITTII